MKLKEVATEVDLVTIESGFRVRKSTNTATAQIKRCLDLNVLRSHREYFVRSALQWFEIRLLHLELHVLPALTKVLFNAPVTKGISKSLLHILLFDCYVWA